VVGGSEAAVSTPKGPSMPVRVSPEAKRELEEIAAELRQRPGYGRLTPGDVVELLLAERKAAAK
jgi:hypothetical protein